MTPSYPNNYENFESDQIDEQNHSEAIRVEANLHAQAEDANNLKIKNFEELTPTLPPYLQKSDIIAQLQDHELMHKTWQNPNNSIVRSASTKSTKSSLKIGQNNLCNPFCINGKIH